jgi:sugar-specific transcriptional regulator TrmB
LKTTVRIYVRLYLLRGVMDRDAFRRLALIRLSGYEAQVLFALVVAENPVELKDIAELTRLRKPHINRSLNGLEDRKIVIIIVDESNVNRKYAVNPNYSEWELLPEVIIRKETIFTPEVKELINLFTELFFYRFHYKPLVGNLGGSMFKRMLKRFKQEVKCKV